MALNATDMWMKMQPILSQEMSSISFQTWIKPLLPISCEGDTFVLQAQNDFARSHAENYAQLIENIIFSLHSVQMKVHIILASERVNFQQFSTTPSMNQTSVTGNYFQQSNYELFKNSFNPLYTFETFIIGPSNSFAQSACFALAEHQAGTKISTFQGNRPLFLYGGSGLGKTHLLHAIGNYIYQHKPQSKIIYITCEEFLNEYVRTVRKGNFEDFHNKYRKCDILMVDDIQFIEKSEALQIEFFNTFNTLAENGKNVIMTSDKPPLSFTKIDERVKTRFSSGFIIDIGFPDFETRIAILEKRAQLANVTIDPQIIEYIATNIVSSIRELEGALNTVIAYTYLNINGGLTIESAKEALKNLITPNITKKMSAEMILQLIARYYRFTEEEIKSKSRYKNLATARQVCMYLLAKHGELTYEQIGQLLGDRHHTTVMHGYNKINEDIKNGDQELLNDITELNRRILGSQG